MNRSRSRTLFSVLKGVLAAVAVTLVLMLALAALVVYSDVSDGLIYAVNQAIKLAAIIAGVLIAVGRGGERGFLTGACVAFVYMALGYTAYILLGGVYYSTLSMLGELLLGAAVGAVLGSVIANMRPKRLRRTA